MTDRRKEIVKRLMGATACVCWEGECYQGIVVFVDYDTLTVLVDAKERQFLVSLRQCQVLEPRREAVGVMHNVRLDAWRYSTGWRGCHLAVPDVADVWLEPVRLAVAG